MRKERLGFKRYYAVVTLLVALVCGLVGGSTAAQGDPLPSWNDGAAKKAIADFVARVTTQDRGRHETGLESGVSGDTVKGNGDEKAICCGACIVLPVGDHDGANVSS
jgi:hypothetical protein